MSAQPDRAAVDGRTARRDRNRIAVLDAVIELFSEDHLQPRPEEVAQRSGVSLRSVYRYYSDPDELLRAAMERHLERALPLLSIHAIGEGTFDERIDRFIEARLVLHESIASSARAARAAAPRNDVIRAQYDRTRQTLRDQIELHFGHELRALPAARRRAIATAVDALVQLQALDYYRVDRSLSHKAAARVLRVALQKLLLD